jgi:hypothetical protein
LTDVRLVYAPPRAVGEYGGEIDNWMWPRHAGDFGIVRAYVDRNGNPSDYKPDNVPYRPKHVLKISQRPLSEDDFVMVLGYPGRTYRSLLGEEMRTLREKYFPGIEDLYGEWIDSLKSISEESEDGRIAVAADLKSMLNRWKNARGQVAGLERGNILAKQLASEKRVANWANGKATYGASIEAREELLRLVEERDSTWHRDFLLGRMGIYNKALYLSERIVRLAAEREKPDMERDASYMERQIPTLLLRMDRAQKSYFPEADKMLFASVVQRAAKLDEWQRIHAFDDFFGAAPGEDRIAAKLDELYRNTKALDPEERARMSRESLEELRARKDPLLDLAFALEQQSAEIREAEKRFSGAVSRLRPQWRKAVMAEASGPIAPDANGTLRVSVAHVEGYEPRDAVYMKPFTTLSGVIEKDTGEEPFDLAERVREAWRQKRFGKWVDASLGDLAVNFLANGDTTGGNSGSPMVNGYGELVGLNFDRV